MANIRRSRRSGLVLRGGRMVRETLWGDFATTESILGGAPTAILANVTGAAFLALRPFTVVRTRGVIMVRSDQVAANESYIGDFGMCVVSDQAVAIGITAVPTPLTDKGSDAWFVYEQLIGRVEAAAPGVSEPSNPSVERPYDSRAMRRVDEGYQIVATVENEVNGCNLIHSARLLIKLH